MSLGQLLENNRSWARGMLAADPEYFARLARRRPVMSDLLLTYRGAVYPRHCDQSMLTGVHIDPEARKACPFPQEILAHRKSLVREYTPPA